VTSGQRLNNGRGLGEIHFEKMKSQENRGGGEDTHVEKASALLLL
jgi:hypothetical protein